MQALSRRQSMSILERLTEMIITETYLAQTKRLLSRKTKRQSGKRQMLVISSIKGMDLISQALEVVLSGTPQRCNSSQQAKGILALTIGVLNTRMTSSSRCSSKSLLQGVREDQQACRGFSKLWTTTQAEPLTSKSSGKHFATSDYPCPQRNVGNYLTYSISTKTVRSPMTSL